MRDLLNSSFAPTLSLSLSIRLSGSLSRSLRLQSRTELRYVIVCKCQELIEWQNYYGKNHQQNLVSALYLSFVRYTRTQAHIPARSMVVSLAKS